MGPPATTTTTTTTTTATSTPSPPSADENEYPDTLEDISEMYLEIRSLLLRNYRRVSFILFCFLYGVIDYIIIFFSVAIVPSFIYIYIYIAYKHLCNAHV